MECEKQTKRKKEIRKTAHDRYLGGKNKEGDVQGRGSGDPKPP